jgi:fluoride ion exporter CrcB/FEX
LLPLSLSYWYLQSDMPQHVRLFLTTGILGGYTTSSAFSLDTIVLYERGEVGLGRALRHPVGPTVARWSGRRARAGAAPFVI